MEKNNVFKMLKEEDIYRFVDFITTYHNDVLFNYHDYDIILVGNIVINEEEGYYIVTNDEKILLFTISENGNISKCIDPLHIDVVYNHHPEEIIFKYNKSKVYTLKGDTADTTVLLEFLNRKQEKKNEIKKEKKNPFSILGLIIIAGLITAIAFVI